jgi:hypothetical protein
MATPRGSAEAFILMPFEEKWSDAVHASIERACEQLQRERAFSWRRADDIAAAGRITDQILTAIADATVLIADVSRENPNVMYELGYGHALGKPAVVLNQLIDNAPFDIKDFRQVAYAANDPAAFEDPLVEALRETLNEIPEANAAGTTEPPQANAAWRPRAPAALRPALQHSTGPFNMPQHGGLNCWLVNDGPETVLIQSLWLHGHGQTIDGHAMTPKGETAGELSVAPNDEVWLEIPAGPELSGLRADRSAELVLDVSFRSLRSNEAWHQAITLRRSLDDGSRAQWLAVAVTQPELLTE